MSHQTLHIADKPDILSLDSEWWKEFREAMKPMEFHLRDLQALFHEGESDDENFKAVYDGTQRLRADMVELKKQQHAVLDKLRESQEEWKTAVSTRNGELGVLDTDFSERTAQVKSLETSLEELKRKRQDVLLELTSLEAQVAQACQTLETTQNDEVALKAAFKDEAVQLCTQKDAFLTRRIQEWGREKDETYQRQRARDDELHATALKLERLSRDLAEREENLGIKQGQAESYARNLKSAHSTLQSLANVTGSSSVATPDLSQTESLALSIRNRFRSLQEDHTAQTRELTKQQNRVSLLGTQLESVTQELGGLKTSYKETTKLLNSSEKRLYELSGKDDELEQLQPKYRESAIQLRRKIEENTSLFAALEIAERERTEACNARDGYQSDYDIVKGQRIPQLEAELDSARRKIKESQSSSDQSKEQYLELRTKHGVLNAQLTLVSEELENLKRELALAQDQTSGLLIYTIPELETSKKLVQDQIQALAQINQASKEHAERTDTEATSLRITNVTLNSSLEKALADHKISLASNIKLMAEGGELREQLSDANKISQETMALLSAERQKFTNLENELSDKNSETSDLRRRVAHLEKVQKTHNTTVTSKNAEIAQLQDHLKEAKSRVQEVEDHEWTEITELKATLEKTEQRYAHLERSAESESIRVSDLQRALEIANTHIRTLDAQLDDQDGLRTGGDDRIQDRRSRSLLDGPENTFNSPPPPDANRSQAQVIPRPREGDGNPEAIFRNARGGTSAKSGKRKASEMEHEEDDRSSARNHDEIIRQDSADPLPVKWSLSAVRQNTFSPRSLPTTVLEKLRANIALWDKVPRWTEPVPGQRRCAETIVSKKASVWPYGEAYQCERCSKIKQLCVVMEKDGMMAILPTHRTQGSPDVSRSSVEYWTGSS